MIMTYKQIKNLTAQLYIITTLDKEFADKWMAWICIGSFS